MSGDAGIAADQGHALNRCLGNEKAVERIALQRAALFDVGKVAIGGGVSWGYGQEREALGEELLGPALRDLELAERGFDRDLEESAGAEERLLGAGDRLAGRE